MHFHRVFRDPLEQSLLVIRVASWLAPSVQRAAWRREWEAEVWHASMFIRERGYSPAQARA